MSGDKEMPIVPQCPYCDEFHLGSCLEGRIISKIHPQTWQCQSCGMNRSDLHNDVCAKCWAKKYEDLKAQVDEFDDEWEPNSL